jgi:hypothetical protein
MGVPTVVTRVGEEAEVAMLTDGTLAVIGIAQSMTLAGTVTITEAEDALAHALDLPAGITDRVVTAATAMNVKTASQGTHADLAMMIAEEVEAPRVVRVVEMGRHLLRRMSVINEQFLFSNLQHV